MFRKSIFVLIALPLLIVRALLRRLVLFGVRLWLKNIQHKQRVLVRREKWLELFEDDLS